MKDDSGNKKNNRCRRRCRPKEKFELLAFGYREIKISRNCLEAEKREKNNLENKLVYSNCQ